MTSPPASPAARIPLLADFSTGVTTKEVPDLGRAGTVVPSSTRIHLGFRIQSSADLVGRLETARAVKMLGLTPVPIIAARQLHSTGMLREYLAGLREAGASASVVIVGGDPEPPLGPYPDASSVIDSGLLEEHGVRNVSVAGHPGGHPAATDDVMWSALAAKAATLERRGLDGGVVTQFGFDPALVLTWLAGLRARGIGLPVRVGVAGPVSGRRLLGVASTCGVSVGADAAARYGFALTDRADPLGRYGFALADPAGEVGPERFIRSLAEGYDLGLHGEVKLHFETFGRTAALIEWLGRVS
jgi:methylenetetrahydrofolate reductase (NADPH)